MAMTFQAFRLVASSCSKQRRNFIGTVALASTAAVSQPLNRTDHNQFQRRWRSSSSSSAANTAAKGGNFSLSDFEELDDMKHAPWDLNQVFQNMLTDGKKMENTVKMIDGLIKYGNFDVAKEIQDQIEDTRIVPKVVIVTAVIDHYANAGRTNDAFKLFLKMLASDVTPNVYTYTVIIKALAACAPTNPNFPHFVKFAKKYFVEMLDKGLQPTPGTYFSLVERIDECRDREEFVELIKAKGFVPPPGAVNEAARDYEIPLNTEGLCEAAFRQRKVFADATKDTTDKEMRQTFEKMHENWIGKEAKRMYDGLIKDHQVDQAKDMFKHIGRGIIPDAVIHTVVIEAYANAGKAEGALKAYKHMLANGVGPNSYTYSVLIKALAADPEFVRDARKYFLEMLDNGIWPNEGTCEAVFNKAKAEDRESIEFFEAVKVKGLHIWKKTSKENDPEDLEEILLSLECGIPIKAKTYNMVIQMLAFKKPDPIAIKYAKKYFLEMLDKGMQPESGTYSIVMEAIACQSDSKAKVMKEAREFLKQVKDKGLVFDNPSYFEFHDRLEDAVDAFRMCEYATRTNDQEMQQIFLKWRTEKDTSMKMGKDMFIGLVDDGLEDEALELCEPVFEMGIHPPIVIHTAVIDAYATAGKIKGALEAYLRMLAVGVSPNSYTYSILIKALASDPNFFGDAKKYLLEMMEKGMPPNACTYTAVFEGFAKNGDKAVEDGREFLSLMKGKGFVPDKEAVMGVLKGKSGELVKTTMNILFGKFHLLSVSSLINKFKI